MENVIMENVNIENIIYMNPDLVNQIDEEKNYYDESITTDGSEHNIIKRLCACFYKVY